jgi:hypothetical protein
VVHAGDVHARRRPAVHRAGATHVRRCRRTGTAASRADRGRTGRRRARDLSREWMSSVMKVSSVLV